MKFEELEVIIRKVFTEESILTIDMHKKDIDSWDSMGHLNLILEIEDELGISFTTDEIEKIDSLKLLYEVVVSKI